MTSPEQATVFLCSPRAQGNSDTAGLAFAKGLTEAGYTPRIIWLREHDITPCRGCGRCAAEPDHRCPFAGDGAEPLFEAMMTSPIVAFAAPIFFYHLPGIFKNFIDRAQRYYTVRLEKEASGADLGPERMAQILLVSGRREGRQLFTGSLLTLKYFLWPFGIRLDDEPALLRGFDGPNDLAADTEAVDALIAKGKAAGEMAQ